MTRREIVAGLMGAVAVSSALEAAGGGVFTAIERRHGGRLGVFVSDLATGRSAGHRTGERFKLYSTFKGLLAGLVLHDIAAGRERLDALVPYTTRDLMSASPITSARVGEGALSVHAMCEAMMFRSDNAAANLLMKRLGGPERLTTFLRRSGDRVTRIDSYEGDIAGKPLPFDSSTPAALIGSAATLMTGPVLPPAQRALLGQWLIGNQVGMTRLRAAFPRDWTSGDRTGTGGGVCNDYAFARRPGRGLLFVAALHEKTGASMADQEAVLRDVGQAVVAWQAAAGGRAA